MTMKKMQCPVDECPKAGDTFVCAKDCGFMIEVTQDCGCTDCECVSLACCSEPMKKVD